MTPIEKNYFAWQGAPWGGVGSDVYVVIGGEDWSDAAFAWKFAAAEGSAAIITLTSQVAGTQGVHAEYFEDYMHPTSGALIPGGATVLTPLISEATFEASPVNDLFTGGATSIDLFHMLYVTPSGGEQDVERFGNLTVRKGVSD